MGRRGRFLVWLAVLTAVWALANRPRDGGSLKPFLVSAGFPLEFAFWARGRLERFDRLALAADLGMGAAFAFSLAWLCAWSSRSRETGPARAPLRDHSAFLRNYGPEEEGQYDDRPAR